MRIRLKGLGLWQVTCTVVHLVKPMSSVAGCELSTRSWVGDQRVPYSGPERRSNDRVSLHWTIHLTCHTTGSRLGSQTLNISPNGFYCIVNQWIKPGDG